MILFYSCTSPYARKVRVVLAEKGLAYEGIDTRVSPRRPSELNPLGKVPTLVLDDATVIYDSTVITEALEALYPEVRLIPVDIRDRLVVRRAEALADGLSDVLIPIVMEGQRAPEQRDPALVAKLEIKVHAALRAMTDHVRSGGFAFGASFSLADIAFVSALGYMRLRRPEYLAAYGELESYHDRMLARSSLAATVPPNLPPV